MSSPTQPGKSQTGNSKPSIKTTNEENINPYSLLLQDINSILRAHDNKKDIFEAIQGAFKKRQPAILTTTSNIWYRKYEQEAEEKNKLEARLAKLKLMNTILSERMSMDASVNSRVAEEIPGDKSIFAELPSKPLVNDTDFENEPIKEFRIASSPALGEYAPKTDRNSSNISTPLKIQIRADHDPVPVTYALDSPIRKASDISSPGVQDPKTCPLCKNKLHSVFQDLEDKSKQITDLTETIAQMNQKGQLILNQNAQLTAENSRVEKCNKDLQDTLRIMEKQLIQIMQENTESRKTYMLLIEQKGSEVSSLQMKIETLELRLSSYQQKLSLQPSVSTGPHTVDSRRYTLPNPPPNPLLLPTKSLQPPPHTTTSTANTAMHQNTNSPLLSPRQPSHQPAAVSPHTAPQNPHQHQPHTPQKDRPDRKYDQTDQNDRNQPQNHQQQQQEHKRRGHVQPTEDSSVLLRRLLEENQSLASDNVVLRRSLLSLRLDESRPSRGSVLPTLLEVEEEPRLWAEIGSGMSPLSSMHGRGTPYSVDETVHDLKLQLVVHPRGPRREPQEFESSVTTVKEGEEDDEQRSFSLDDEGNPKEPTHPRQTESVQPKRQTDLSHSLDARARAIKGSLVEKGTPSPTTNQAKSSSRRPTQKEVRSRRGSKSSAIQAGARDFKPEEHSPNDMVDEDEQKPIAGTKRGKGTKLKANTAGNCRCELI